MFELCDRLFGIYKVRNCTSATYIAPDLLEFDEKKKLNKPKAVTASSNAPTTSVLTQSSQKVNEQANEDIADENPEMRAKSSTNDENLMNTSANATLVN
jgi:hypothetical protein